MTAEALSLPATTPEDFPRTAVVTGSDSGIGRAVAVALAADGCDVGITWHADEVGAHATADEVRSLGGGPRCAGWTSAIRRTPPAS